jgi:ArsR family transcriptional regulator
MMNHDALAAAFKALGDPTRLRLFLCLRACCTPVVIGDSGEVRPADGPTVGEVCCQVTGVPKVTSTLSAHLKELRLAGLITMEKRGKHVVCAVRPDTVAALRAFLDLAQETPDGCC